MQETLIKTMSTIELTNLLTQAQKNQDQFLINRLAYELASRIYVPNQVEITFDDLLYRFGYKEIDKDFVKIYKKK